MGRMSKAEAALLEALESAALDDLSIELILRELEDRVGGVKRRSEGNGRLMGILEPMDERLQELGQHIRARNKWLRQALGLLQSARNRQE